MKRVTLAALAAILFASAPFALANSAYAAAMSTRPYAPGDVCTAENYQKFLSGHWDPKLNLDRCDWSAFKH